MTRLRVERSLAYSDGRDISAIEFIAYDGQKKIGRAIAEVGYKGAHVTYPVITWLGIDKQYQRKGYGRKLARAVEREIRQGIPDRPIGLVAAESAVPFWEKLGYERVPTHRDLQRYTHLKRLGK